MLRSVLHAYRVGGKWVTQHLAGGVRGVAVQTMGVVSWGLLGGHCGRSRSEDQRRYRSKGWWPDHSVGERMAAALAAQGGQSFVIHSRTCPWRGTFADVLTLARRVACPD